MSPPCGTRPGRGWVSDVKGARRRTEGADPQDVGWPGSVDVRGWGRTVPSGTWLPASHGYCLGRLYAAVTGLNSGH